MVLASLELEIHGSVCHAEFFDDQLGNAFGQVWLVKDDSSVPVMQRNSKTGLYHDKSSGG
jgi:hypothetical protein